MDFLHNNKSNNNNNYHDHGPDRRRHVSDIELTQNCMKCY